MDTDRLPDDPSALKAVISEMALRHEADIASRERAISQHRATISEHKAVISDKEQYISHLEEQVRLLKAWRYAAHSEKTAPRQGEDQYSLFDEAELAKVEAEAEEEDSGEVRVTSHTRKKKGRAPLPPEYPREEVLHDIPEEDKVCGCGSRLTRIGEEVSEKLDVIPARVRVIRHVRPKYACRSCEGVEDERPTVRTAPMPPQIIPQGIVTAGLLAYVLVQKFVDGLPFYRQERMFARLGVEISRSTLSGWALRAARACRPLVDALHQEIRSGPLINMDETHVQVLGEAGRKNTSKSQMWVARGGPPDMPVVLFHYDPSRSGKVAEEIVGDFTGYLQTDGYFA